MRWTLLGTLLDSTVVVALLLDTWTSCRWSRGSIVELFGRIAGAWQETGSHVNDRSGRQKIIIDFAHDHGTRLHAWESSWALVEVNATLGAFIIRCHRIRTHHDLPFLGRVEICEVACRPVNTTTQVPRPSCWIALPVRLAFTQMPIEASLGQTRYFPRDLRVSPLSFQNGLVPSSLRPRLWGTLARMLPVSARLPLLRPPIRPSHC